MQEARQLLIQKEYNKAFTLYDKLLADSTISDQDKSICSLNCAICQINQQDYLKALEYAEKSIEYNPRYEKAHYRKAQILINLKRYTEALEIINKLPPCPEIIDMKQLIAKQFSDPLSMLDDFKECSTEKDVIRLFSDLYSRSDYINFNKALEAKGFCAQILDLGFPLHQLKFISYAFQKSGQANLPEWLQNKLLEQFDFYFKSNQEKKPYDLIQNYLSLFIHMRVDKFILDLILKERELFLNKYLKSTCQLMIHNQQIEVGKEFIEQIALFAKKDQNFMIHSEMYYLILDVLKILTKPKVRFFDFLKRDTFRYQDLLILISIISNNQLQEISEIYKDISVKLLCTLQKKIKKIRYIDCINQILMMTLQNHEFCEEINKGSVQLAEQLVKWIQEYRLNKEISQNVKIFCLLFLLQSKGKYLQLYEYIYAADCELLLSHILTDGTIEIDETIVLLQFIVCFDDVKKLIMKRRDDLKTLGNKLSNFFTENGQTSLQQLRQYQILVGYLNILVQLTTDRSEEYKEEQKQKFQIGDQEYEQARQFAQQYQQDVSQKYYTYTNSYIQEEKIIKFIALDMQTIRLLSQFIHKYQEIITNENIIAKLLNQFSLDEEVQKYLFDKQCLKIVSKSILGNHESGIAYLCKQMRNANPDLFDFKDAQLICDALFVSANRAGHELLTFYALLGIVQLSSLGDFIVNRIIEKKQHIQLQNYLLEQNNYIVHASLEILNNVALNEQFLVMLEENQLPTFLKIIIALTQQNYEDLDNKPNMNPQDFSHPRLILNTLIGLIAIISQVIIVQDLFKKELPLLNDKKFYSKILPGCDETQMKKIKIIWEEYEYCPK